MRDSAPIEELLTQALRRAEGPERDAWVKAACEGVANVEVELRGLIAAHERAGAFMAEPLVDNRPEPDNGLQPGTHIGRYELRELLGEGGFGQVWRAVQHEPVRREVALKLLKPGRDSREVVARFDQERQALALMDHSNIAHVFDADAASDGRLFFVMELVHGVPLLEYCDREQLDTPHRLELFLGVCHAIQHAHSKGIIHRDIKPSNVLVTIADDHPMPKVIDFGVAKAVEDGSISPTSLTTNRQMIGTPAYMSPEQASMSTRAVDTRSDVYSLGALLYELLTSVPPFDHETLGEADFESMLRTIREVEPPKPSSRTTDLGSTSTTVATQRRTDSSKLRSLLRGDLDWIAMKCLEKDPARRYETVSGLADDVERYLDDEPVSVGPPTGIYRVRKFVRRNRMGVAAAAVIASALTVATVGLTLGFIRSARAEADAVAEAEKATTEKEIAQAINDFLREDLLASAAPSAAPGRGRDVRMGDVLDAAGRRIDDAGAPGGRFEHKPLVEASIRYTLGWTYRELGDPAASVPHLERSMRLRREARGDEDRDTLDAASLLAVAYMEVGRTDEAMTLFSTTLETQERALGEEDIATLHTMSRLSLLHGQQGRYEEAETLLRRAIDIQERVLDDEHELRLGTLFNLSILYQHQGRYEDAEPLAREVLDVATRTLGPEDPKTLLAMGGTAEVLDLLGRDDEAERLYLNLLERQRRVQGEEHPATLSTMMSFGSMLVEQGRVDEAAPLLEGAAEIYERMLGADHQYTLNALHALGALYITEARYADAIPVLERAVDGARRTLPDGHWVVGAFLSTYGAALTGLERYEEAEAKLLEAHAITEAVLGPAAPPTIERIGSLAMLYDAWGKPEIAASWWARFPGGEPPPP